MLKILQLLFVCSLSLAPVEFVASAQRQQAGSVIEIKSLDQIEHSQASNHLFL